MDLVQDSQMLPPSKNPVERRVVPVVRWNLTPATSGALAVEDAIEGAAGIRSRAARGKARVQSVKNAFDAPPGAIGNFPFAFRRTFGAPRAPVRVAHKVKI